MAKRNYELQDKGLTAAENFLERKCYEVYHTKNELLPLVAIDEDDEPHFCIVRVFDDEFGEENFNRQDLEAAACSILVDNSGLIPLGALHFDCLDMVVTGDGQALLRHHSCMELK